MAEYNLDSFDADIDDEARCKAETLMIQIHQLVSNESVAIKQLTQSMIVQFEEQFVDEFYEQRRDEIINHQLMDEEMN